MTPIRCITCDKLPEPIPGCPACAKRRAAQWEEHRFFNWWALPLVLLLLSTGCASYLCSGAATPQQCADSLDGGWPSGHYSPTPVPGGWIRYSGPQNFPVFVPSSQPSAWGHGGHH